MANAIINMASLQLQTSPPPPRAVLGAFKSPYQLQTNPSQGTQKFSLSSRCLTNQISTKSANGSSRNKFSNVGCCMKYPGGECEQDERTQMEKCGMPEEGEIDDFVLDLWRKAALPGMAALVPFLMDAENALAVGGQFGILEGRTAALIHPIVMGALFVYTLWAGYLGWQWRRVRTIQEEISGLKKQVKPQPKEEGDTPHPPSPVETKIQQLTEERKELLKGSFRDRHFNAGSILLGFGVLEAIGGCVNTYMRTGKLFPGPHLFAGAGITGLWALAAALVPAMQKGNDLARNLHIALNGVNVILFIWQIPTGIEIVLKVFEFTKWP